MSLQISNQGKRSAAKAKLLRLVCIIWVALSFVVIYRFKIRTVGDLAESNDGHTVISVGSHPAIFVWDAVAVVLFVALMLMDTDMAVLGAASRGRRIAAFLIDFWFSLLMLSGIAALAPLWLEASRTGHFAWHFQRNYAVPTDDVVSTLFTFGILVLIFLYFALPLTRGRQTVGCFIMKIRVTPPFGDGGRFTFRSALQRTWYELIGLGDLLKRKWDQDGQGRTSHDIRTNCAVVLIEDS